MDANTRTVRKGSVYEALRVSGGDEERCLTETKAALMAACKKRSLILGKNGDTVAGYNNVVALSPPLSIAEDYFKFIAATI